MYMVLTNVCFLSQYFSSSYGLDDKKFENEHVVSNMTDYEQVSETPLCLTFLISFTII